MAAESVQRAVAQSTQPVIHWLLDSDPSIRWQAMRDLRHEPNDVVAAERARIAAMAARESPPR